MTSTYHAQQKKKFKKIAFWLLGLGIVFLVLRGSGLVLLIACIPFFIVANGHANLQHTLEQQEALYVPVTLPASTGTSVRNCPSCLQATQAVGDRCSFCGCLI
jgi:hypothetical protein